jgi:uncharacterized protein (DUF1499 family)
MMAEPDDDVGIWPLRIACFAVGLFVLGPLGAHLDVLPPFAGFLAFVAGGAIGLLNSIAGLVVFRRGARVRGILIMAASEIPALVLIYSSVSGLGKPLINDITTDLVEPPNLIAAQDRPGNRGRDMVYPESFKDQIRAGYSDLKPLHLDEPPDEVFARAVKLAQSHPDWDINYVNGSNRTFEGAATSWLFRFQDDFVVRVRPDGKGSVVDMRSKSRDGQGDLGKNAERIRSFLTELAKAR